MSFLKYSNCWSKEKINLSEDILELINNSSLNLFDVSEVLRDMSERCDNFARRSGSLFSAAEVMPRVEKEIKKHN